MFKLWCERGISDKLKWLSLNNWNEVIVLMQFTKFLGNVHQSKLHILQSEGKWLAIGDVKPGYERSYAPHKISYQSSVKYQKL